MKTFRTPAFWDLHIHGVAGIDFMHASIPEMLKSCEILGRNGIAAFAPTLLTAEPKLLEKACSRWGNFLNDLSKDPSFFLSPTAAIPVGLHLEGPFLSSKMSGAHPKNALKTASIPYFKKLHSLAQGQIAIVTIAPEINGAITLISHLKRQKIRIQIGHTEASQATIQKAIRAGATGVTHLFNAMRIHHRDSGVLAPLSDGKLTAEIITDGIHVSHDYLAYTYSAVGVHLYGVSDGCSAVGCKSSRDLTLGSLKLKREGSVAVVAKTGTLAGGATYLTAHPELFKKNGYSPVRSEFFEMFYKIPSQIFPKTARLVSGRKNIFSESTWKFVSSHSKP